MKQRDITPGQLKKLHTLLNQAGLMKHKAELVYSYSGGRAASRQTDPKPCEPVPKVRMPRITRAQLEMLRDDSTE